MAEALTTRSDWLAAHPPARERLSQTLAGVAGRVRGGEDFRHAASGSSARCPGFRAVAIAQAPAAFRRRGVFIPERSLHRV